MSCNGPCFISDKCQCKLLDSEKVKEVNSNNVVNVQPHSRRISLRNSFNYKERHNFLLSLIEAFYEKCAAYNLRYCPIKRYKKHDSYLWSAIKDIVILACFMMANFVVFLAIITQTMVHIYHVLNLLVQWVKRSFKTKMEEKVSSELLSPPMCPGHIQSSSHRRFL